MSWAYYIPSPVNTTQPDKVNPIIRQKIIDRYNKRHKELGYKVKDTQPIMINLMNNKL